MSETNQYKGLLQKVTDWAINNEFVDVVVLTGSRARSCAEQDEYSDLDIELISEDMANLAGNDAWIESMCSPITILRLEPSEDQQWPTRLVICDNGCKIDFTLASHQRLLDIKSSGIDSTYSRGYRILIDKTGVTADLPRNLSAGGEKLPDEVKFKDCVSEFWFEAFHVPRCLARGDLWLVKQRDWTMKELLLQMIEWHTLATSRCQVDTWHLGRSISKWADPKLSQEISSTFGRYEMHDSIRAFKATTDLYAKLSQEVAVLLNFRYPIEVQTKIERLCNDVLKKIAKPFA